jgi:CYTH domain-containing protein
VSGHLEIERAWLLRGAPPLPDSHVRIIIEQGYMPGPYGDQDEGRHGARHESRHGTRDVSPHGARLRRAVHHDGSVHCTLTRKSGAGLVRHEEEHALDPTAFDGLWPATIGRRISKVRHVVVEDALRWEIDCFAGIDLWLAEVELPCVDTTVVLPAWLAPWAEREVTDDPRYRNSALALRGIPQAP